MNNQIKCGFCGIVNWKNIENCIKCDKKLQQESHIRQSRSEKADSNSSFKKVFIVLSAVIGIALIGSFLIIDKTSGTSLFERQFWRVSAPDEAIIKQAINERINIYSRHTVIDPGYNEMTMQCKNGSWQTINGVHDFKCTNSGLGFDNSSFRPGVIENSDTALDGYEILSAEISKYSFAGTPEPERESFIRYKAKIKVNATKTHSITSSMSDPTRDLHETEKQISEVVIALQWNPKKSSWELSRFFN